MSDKGTFKQGPERNDGVSCFDLWKMSFSNRRNSKHKGPEAEHGQKGKRGDGGDFRIYVFILVKCKAFEVFCKEA